jgi:alpha-mannosidase
VIRHTEYTRARLAQTSDRLRAAIYPETRAVDELAVSPRVDRIPRDEALALEYRPAAVGERFGPLWATFWFRAAAAVPESWAGSRVDLLWDSAGEATLWLGGEPAQGLNPHHRDAVLVDRAGGGEPVAFEVELACNGLFGRQDAPAELRRCELARFDPDAWRLYHDFETLRALAADAPNGLDEAWAGELDEQLNAFCNDPDPAILARLYERRNASATHEVAAVGHAHLDTAWLWPLAETYRKAVRTFTTQLRYLGEYPGYRFACSQAQQYAWIRHRDPALWARLRAAVAAGGFVPAGGTWVEPDCNIPSGESLVRQFLHGQRFFERELGRRAEVFWNPDVFGYNGQLPQLMRGAGISGFLTQKLSWNRYTAPEHHTFRWVGIDGSSVIAHFPPADTYNAEATVPELRRAARDFKDHERSARSLLVFGWGDGGGGPTAEMLETLARAEDLQDVPRTVIGEPEAFFRELEREAEWPEVVGELYLEYHRGTYTTQARTKRGNRRSEHLLREAELWAATASVREGVDYPAETLRRCWETVLLQQFHDILPGTSIAWVHRQAEREYARVAVELEGVIADALTLLVGPGDRELAANAGPYAVDGVPGLGVSTFAEPVLESDEVRVVVDDRGLITSIYDKVAGRELVPAGRAANLLQLHRDTPTYWDAWDIDRHYRRHVVDLVEGAVDGMRVVRRFGASTVTQTIALRGRTIEIDTGVAWHERQKLLKLAFPLDVHADRAASEIQFGHVHRPTHANTSWDAARFETCAHRWVHVGEPGYGVAVANDGTYGHDITRDGPVTTVRLSLLRAPLFPDPDADQGEHRFRVSVTVGATVGDAVAEGYRLNLPPRRVRGGNDVAPLVVVDDPAVVVEAVKLAEDGSGDVVVRLYEALGSRASARITATFDHASVAETDLLERPLPEAAALDGDRLALRPFQIVTVRFKRC